MFSLEMGSVEPRFSDSIQSEFLITRGAYYHGFRGHHKRETVDEGKGRPGGILVVLAVVSTERGHFICIRYMLHQLA